MGCAAAKRERVNGENFALFIGEREKPKLPWSVEGDGSRCEGEEGDEDGSVGDGWPAVLSSVRAGFGLGDPP